MVARCKSKKHEEIFGAIHSGRRRRRRRSRR